MEYKLMEMCDAVRLAEFEKAARLTEPGILYGEIVEEEYAQKTVERMADPILSTPG